MSLSLILVMIKKSLAKGRAVRSKKELPSNPK
jgi:hypothetical protein